MNLDSIRQEFIDKNFSERDLELISNFIDEFDILYGKYVSREEVIKRIKSNLDSIEYVEKFKKDNVLGRYDGKNRKVQLLLEKADDAELKSIFFHEMVHCITNDMEQVKVGFIRELDVDGTDHKVIRGQGLTEGFTTYATRKRDEQFGNGIYSYPVLFEQIENITDLIGEETFLNIGFNRPGDFLDEIASMFPDYFEGYAIAEELYDILDVIWKKEDKILAKRKVLLYELFENENFNRNEEMLIRRMADVYGSILENTNITTVREFEKMYYLLKKILQQVGGLSIGSIFSNGQDIKLFERLYPKIEELLENGISLEEILNELSIEPRTFVQQERLLTEFEELTNKEKIERLVDPTFISEIEESGFYNGYFDFHSLSRLSSGIVDLGTSEKNYEFSELLMKGLAKIISNNSWNLERLGIGYIDFISEEIGELESLFVLYDTGIKESDYLGMFRLNDNKTGIIRYIPAQLEILEKDPREYLGEEYDEESTFLLQSEDGDELIGYCGDGRYIGEYSYEGEIEHFESNLEILFEKLKGRYANLKEIQESGASNFRLDRMRKLVEETIEEIRMITSDKTSSPTRTSEETEIEEVIDSIDSTEEKRKTGLRKIGMEDAR